jgi:membrane-associated protease RseP (regulator of RpoE activity)
MPEDYYSPDPQTYFQQNMQKKRKKNVLLHLSLFLVTFATTTIAGTFWLTGNVGPYEINHLLLGLPYAFSILFIITCHEFGHYFAAKFHNVDATLPFYIPFPPIPLFLNFGTMGAVIKTRTPIYTRKAMFDIGASGPIAGFIACLIVLVYGFTNLPGKEFILSIHPDYFSPDYGKDIQSFAFGDTLLFSFLKMIFVQPGEFFPPMSEVYHYPFLCVGWFGLFITAMNMIPVGQLDGGHIGYAMFGDKNQYNISLISFGLLLIFGAFGVADMYFQLGYNVGWSGWLFWALVLFFIIKLRHPPISDETELDPKRKMLGYFSYFILIISFSPTPFILTL